ncbi:MFS transporter [Olivibacter sitiensis]|uniref:MFS transporter n=1 Tax=Olivibacter sitiensis TaxID=376470 RepID=UPI00041CFB98|nr:MFS transporter [Olivibacter sitiensis]
MDLSNQVLASTSHRRRVRLAVSLFYFCQGFAFASWASRIPDIKSSLHLSDGQLGSILLALPLGQLLTMALSGQLVARYGSKMVLTLSVPLYGLALTNLGLATQAWHLALCLLLFGVIGNMCNISLNTQGVAAEKFYGRPIMSSFHGAWSIAGFSGALMGLLMMNLHFKPYAHFWVIAVFVFINTALNFRYLIAGVDPQPAGKRKFFSRPEGVLLQLGIIGFCSMAAEGAMFDWSGVYFKDIVKAPRSLVVLGYASFMVMMATGRFLGDGMITRFGRKRVLQICGLLISIGMFTAVLLPYLPTATIGFMMVGLGVSCMVPSVYSLAGQNKTVSAGIALAMVSSVSYLGFLIGPPLIGYIAEMANLRYSYAVIGMAGMLVTLLVSRLKLFS